MSSILILQRNKFGKFNEIRENGEFSNFNEFSERPPGPKRVGGLSPRERGEDLLDLLGLRANLHRVVPDVEDAAADLVRPVEALLQGPAEGLTLLQRYVAVVPGP